jgi:2'-5' RNA ligase
MRLFVALDLPADARAALAAWADAAAPPIVRRTPAENLHVTLAFLGSRSEDEATTVGARLSNVIRPLDSLRTGGALWLPRRHPGVLTVALRDDAQLSGLQADLAAELESAIDFESERRRFRPHVTVGRVPRGTRIDTRPALHPPVPELEVRAPALTLYCSHTGAGGARYEMLASVALV